MGQRPRDLTPTRSVLDFFGAELRLLRDNAGLSMAELGGRITFDSSLVGRVERAQQVPTEAFAAACDDALGADGRLKRLWHLLDAKRRRTSDRADGSRGEANVGSVDNAPLDSPEEIGRRRHSRAASNVDDAKLAYLEATSMRAMQASERQPPATLAPHVRSLCRHVRELITGIQHPPERARLYAVGVNLSGIMGALALDLGYQRSACEYGLEAYELADAVDRPDLRAWARATQSLIAYYGGAYHDALAFAHDGQRWARGGPHRVRLAINGEARALAKLGDSYGVDEAVDRAFTALADAPATDGVSPSLTTGWYCTARTAANAATAYLSVGNPGKVIEYASRALCAFDDAGLHGPQALSRLDLATAALMGIDPEPEHACGLAAEALTVAADERFESVSQRAGEFLQVARPWVTTRYVRDVAELVRSHAIRPALES